MAVPVSALIVTAELAPRDFAWFDQLRRTHFPPERNQVPAHLTMFHALPPSSEVEVRHRLSELARRSPPKATVSGLMDLGRGTAFRIASDDLQEIRADLADGLGGLLGPQDSAGWAPHVTIQNKVDSKAARSLRESLQRGFEPRPLAVSGLGLHRYLGGPWKQLIVYPFRGVR